MCFPVSATGFFAKSQIMFFLPSSFRFCPPLKNDGSGELRFREAVNDFLYKRKNRECKPSEVASVRRNGRMEKTNGQSAGGWKGISFMQNNISVFMVK